jgi:predicted enzyme related to lactoylglutathione lyase
VSDRHEPLILAVDSVQLPVDDLDAALAFYRDELGHELVWRTDTAAGLRIPDSEAEIVVQKDRPEMESNLLVASVSEAAERVVAAGGSIEAGPFEIQIGRCVVVRDPWNNRLVLLDMTKGRLTTDQQGNITGNKPTSS